MSRPGYRKDDDKRRDRHVSFRCTEAEYALIGDAADDIGTSVSKLARARTLEQTPPRRPPTQVNVRAAAALNRLAAEVKHNGRNANQLARQANAHFIDNNFEQRLTDYMARMDTLIEESRAVVALLMDQVEDS